jgi:predicted MFS family arabinose efflux permease
MPTIPIYLTEALNIEHSHVGIVMSSYALAMLVSRPYSGYIIDVFNRKKVFLLCLSLFVATFIGYLFAITVMAFMIIRFVHGLFWGVSTVSSNTVAIDIIPASRRAEGIGYFGMNMNLAMAIAPFFAISIYDAFGFQVLIFCSILMGILSIIAVFFIKTTYRLPLQEKPTLSLDRFILIQGIPIFINQVLVTIGWGMLISFAVLYGRDIHIPNPGIFFLFLAFGLILSRITSGRYVDKGYIHLIAIIALSIICVSFFTFAYFHTVVSFCTSAFFIGVGFGTMLPAFQTSFINMAAHNRRGTANSTYLTGFDLGLGIGMLTGGAISEMHSLSYLFYVASSLSFVAVWMYVFVSRKVYEKNKVKVDDIVLS